MTHWIKYIVCATALMIGEGVYSIPTPAQSPTEQVWEHVATYDDGFFAPDDFWLSSNEQEQNSPRTALVLDSQSNDQLLAVLNLREANPTGRSLVSGQGPGELSGNGLAVSKFANGNIFVWDDGQRRANIYTRSLQLEGQVDDTDSYLSSRTMLVNDSTIATVVNNPGPELLRLHRLQEQDGQFSLSPSFLTVKTTDHSSFDRQPIVENTMLRQFHHARSDGTVFIASYFSSHLFAVDESGLVWASNAPANQPFPEYEFRDGNTIYAPSVDETPLGILDVDSDNEYVYALYSGEQIEDNLSPFARSEIVAAMERIHHSDRLFVYEKESGEWVTEIQLPMRTKKINISNGYLGLLTDEAREPTFEIYRMPSLP